MKKSISLTEVIVGAVILAGTFAALFATFVGVRRYVKRANKRLITVNLEKRVFGDLYRYVRQDTWDTGGLKLTLGVPVDLPDYSIDNIIYQRSSPDQNRYEVNPAAGMDYRKVTVTINYPM